MQHAKDSFLLALRDRLAALAPDRTVTVDGAARPAVLASENEAATSAPPLPRAFCLRWGACTTPAAASELRRMECDIFYRTGPGDSNARGREMTALDLELLAICTPPHVAKCDYARSPAVPLGSNVFWTEPQFDAPEDGGTELRRHARLAVFFVPEAAQ